MPKRLPNKYTCNFHFTTKLRYSQIKKNQLKYVRFVTLKEKKNSLSH